MQCRVKHVGRGKYLSWDMVITVGLSEGRGVRRGLLVAAVSAVVSALLLASLPILLGREAAPEAGCVINEVVLRYRIEGGSIIYHHKDADVLVRGSNYLVVHAVRSGEGWLVEFTLNASGLGYSAPGGEPSSVGYVGSVELYYEPGRGFTTENGELLGVVFPLFLECGEVMNLSYVYAKLGEPPTLGGRLEPVTLVLRRRWTVSLEDLDKALVELNESGKPEELVRKFMEHARVIRKLAEMAGGEEVELARYSEDMWGTTVIIETRTGIPTFLVLRGAPRTLPTSKIIVNGVEVHEVPASPLAILLDIHDDVVTLRLEELSYRC